ncbi:MAG TPA: hypothetical protein VKV15_02320, partial [Bryobacteraceae bacterium]|nr:hypothetical protein [Bryobacteraceae bacterium]
MAADNAQDVNRDEIVEAIRQDEIVETIREIRDRVRARHPAGSLGVGGIAIPNLMPIVHSRDAASSKVAAIGTVNPRPAGIVNSAIQAVKRLVARALDWHVRDQVEFNRGMIACVESILEALTENNRALSQLAGHFEGQISELRAHTDRQGQKDLQAHWAQWRVEWEDKLAKSEIYLLRSVSELQGAFQHR